MNANPLRVLISSPHHGMASELRARFAEEVGFEVAAVLESHPGVERLQLALDHFRPDCVYVQCDDLPAATGFMDLLHKNGFLGPIVSCAMYQQADPVVDLLRRGAFDYLRAPIEPAVFHEVAARVRAQCRRLEEDHSPVRRAHAVAFTSNKPGSGATTLAMQCAYALRKLTGRRVLSMDLNVLSGTSAGYTEGMLEPFDVLDAAAALPGEWGCFGEAMQFNGVSILPAPAAPEGEGLAGGDAQGLLEAARRRFDWVILDLPCAVAPETLRLARWVDALVVVTTPELASLNMLRRNVQLLRSSGVAAAALHLALNRTSPKDMLKLDAIECGLKIPFCWSFPNDYFSLQAAGQLGLTGQSALAAAVRRMAADLRAETDPPTPQRNLAPAEFSLAGAV